MGSRRESGSLTPRPTTWCVALLLLIAAFTVVVHARPVLTLCLVGALLGAFLVDLWILTHATVSFTRSAPTSLPRGTARDVEMSLVTTARVVRLRHVGHPNISLAPSESSGNTLSMVVTGVRRGRMSWGPCVARLAGPLSLCTMDRRGSVPGELQIIPDLPRARRLVLQRRLGRAGGEVATARRRGIGTEFETIRDYDDNDDVRHINWMATSRANRPMTNVYRVDENRDLICLVDAGRVMATTLANATRLDGALDAVCALAAAADDAGDRVGVLAFRDTILRSMPPRHRGAREVVETIFDLDAEEVESNYTRAFTAVATRKRSIVAIATDIGDTAASRELLDALPVLAARHAVILVSQRDDELTGVGREAPRDYADVVRASLRLEEDAAHARLVSRIRMMGVIVIDAPADRIAGECLRAYATMKSRAVA